MTTLQQRVDAVLARGAKLPASVLNVLIQDLANAKETDAVVRVWDILGGEGPRSPPLPPPVGRDTSRGCVL